MYEKKEIKMDDFNIRIIDNPAILSQTEIIELYKSGVKVKDIAHKVQKSPATIYTILYKSGVELNKVGRPKKKVIIQSTIKKGVKLSSIYSNQDIKKALTIITKEIVQKNETNSIDSIVEKVLKEVYRKLTI